MISAKGDGIKFENSSLQTINAFFFLNNNTAFVLGGYCIFKFFFLVLTANSEIFTLYVIGSRLSLG